MEKKITIRVRPEVHKKLKLMAVKQDIPVNEICTRLLKMYFKKPSMVEVEVKKK